jgi:hypothetical protein
VKLLDAKLPAWYIELDDDDPTSRLDNNWYSPAARLAEVELQRAADSGRFFIKTVEEICEPKGIDTGSAPEEDGEIGIIEGRNLRPNYVIPIFMKFASEPTDLIPNDLVVGKDGEPGTVAIITESLLDYCGSIAIGGHVYRLRLLEQYRVVAPFISAFLNSRIGQAILRKRIAGGTTPTIRKADIKTIEVLIPTDFTCPGGMANAVQETQKRVLESMDNLGPSKNIDSLTGMKDIAARLPVNWAGGGAARSSRIIS